MPSSLNTTTLTSSGGRFTSTKMPNSRQPLFDLPAPNVQYLFHRKLLHMPKKYEMPLRRRLVHTRDVRQEVEGGQVDRCVQEPDHNEPGGLPGYSVALQQSAYELHDPPQVDGMRPGKAA